MVTLDGIITAFEVTLASTDDREGSRDIVSEQSIFAVIGDKGYIGEKLASNMAEQKICLLALKRNNSKHNWSRNSDDYVSDFAE